MSTEECEMIALEFDDISPEGDVPKYVRTILFESCEPDGIYLPACVFGHEQNIYTAALLDLAYTITHLDHVFVPASWVAKAMPSEDTDVAIRVCTEAVRIAIEQEVVKS